MTRVPLVRPEELPEAFRHVVESKLFEEHPDALTDEYRQLRREDTALPSYRALAHQPAALAALRSYQGTLWHDVDIAPRTRELVILTVSREAGAAYQWHSHVRVALVEGVDPETIIAVSNRAYDDLDPADAAVLRYVEAFVRDEVDDAAHAAITDHLDDRALVGLCLLAGFYLMFSRLIGALNVETDEGFVGWHLENLRP